MKTGNRQLGPLLLSGLMIGPILGSGIIILPPLAYGVAGDWAIFAWILMTLAGVVFAFTFGRLSILYPGSAGVTTAIGAAFGERTGKLTALYLIGAVLFGPVAVMLTAAEYLFPDSASAQLVALPILLACSLLLQKGIASIGRIALVLSSLAAITLLVGGAATLLFHQKPAAPLPAFPAVDFGYALLLLFWTIVGWEVVGNYSGEVCNPKRTIMAAVGFSAAVIAAVSLTVASAVQFADPALAGSGRLQVTAIITPIFGSLSRPVMAAITLSLCTTTYLLFVGGVARLARALAGENFLPNFLSAENRAGAPVGAIRALTLIHLAVTLAAACGTVTVETLVALADGFFIANAAIGIAAAYRLFPGLWPRLATLLLGCFFVVIFLQSHLPVILIVLVMAGLTLARKKMTQVVEEAG